MAGNYTLLVSESELKMLLVAVRQVKNTLRIAEEQSLQAGEPLGEQYDPVKESYAALERKLAGLLK
ncbi:MAG: hypothetical protein IT158_00060 [Bryobacterales bacterium]|nr:hypothetical protein [Bryobacterales bacterium]